MLKRFKMSVKKGISDNQEKDFNVKEKVSRRLKKHFLLALTLGYLRFMFGN